MPGHIRAVPGTNTMFAMFQNRLWHEDNSILWTVRYPNGNRGLNTRDQMWTFPGGWWPATRMGFYSDPTAPCSLVFGSDESSCTSGDYEPPMFGVGGSASQKFIMGVCRDELDVVVSGAIVQGFRTSDDLYVGETTANSSGEYQLGTPHPATNHYLVAYRAGAPDIAGTTVNTLQGTNADGT